MRGPAGYQHIRTFRAQVVNIPAGIGVIAGTAEDQANLPAAANVRALGVTAAPTVNVDDSLPVVMFGETVATANGAIAVGQWVMINGATGRLAPIGAVAGTNYEVVGMALSVAVADGDDFLILVNGSRAQG